MMAFLPVDNLVVGLLMVRGVDLYGIVSMVWYVQHTYCRVLHTFLVFPWGGMNSWFLNEFTVLSMGSILANIAERD